MRQRLDHQRRLSDNVSLESIDEHCILREGQEKQQRLRKRKRRDEEKERSEAPMSDGNTPANRNRIERYRSIKANQAKALANEQTKQCAIQAPEKETQLAPKG